MFLVLKYWTRATTVGLKWRRVISLTGNLSSYLEKSFRCSLVLLSAQLRIESAKLVFRECPLLSCWTSPNNKTCCKYSKCLYIAGIKLQMTIAPQLSWASSPICTPGQFSNLFFISLEDEDHEPLLSIYWHSRW